jgi:1,4-alpha-glucan branching enzyme
MYRDTRALHELDCEPAGFRWIDPDDKINSVLSYERLARDGSSVVCAFNFTPVPRHNYRVGVARPGVWHELLNTDSATFGGSGQGNLGATEAMPVRSHGRELSLAITVPPLGAVWFTAS